MTMKLSHSSPGLAWETTPDFNTTLRNSRFQAAYGRGVDVSHRENWSFQIVTDQAVPKEGYMDGILPACSQTAKYASQRRPL